MTQQDVTTEVVDGRRSVYGEPSESFPRVAQAWSAILGTEVRPDQVPLLLIGYKLIRASECPEYSDNIDDVDGYAKIFREVMGDRLIEARSVTEFLEKKAARERQEQAAEMRAAIPVLTGFKQSTSSYHVHVIECRGSNRERAMAGEPWVCICPEATPQQDRLVDGELGTLK
jgi:hypothetical protein